MKKILVVMFVCCLIFAGCMNGKEPITDVIPSTNQQEETIQVTEVVETESTTESTAGPMTITVYKPNDDFNRLETVSVEVLEINSKNIIDALVQNKVINKTIRIQSEEINEDSAGRHLRIDFNEEFRNYISSFGTSGEFAIMGSIVNTFIDTLDVDDVFITVCGDVLETGHCTYDEPLPKYPEKI